MKNEPALKHEFVEFIPDRLEDGMIYISVIYATAAHKCCCGCGSEVNTPLSPTDWRLIFDGASISLEPSIGNWNFPCRSHYWVSHSKVIWAQRWSQDTIDAERAKDRQAKERYFTPEVPVAILTRPAPPECPVPTTPKAGFWRRLMSKRKQR